MYYGPFSVRKNDMNDISDITQLKTQINNFLQSDLNNLKLLNHGLIVKKKIFIFTICSEVSSPFITKDKSQDDIVSRLLYDLHVNLETVIKTIEVYHDTAYRNNNYDKLPMSYMIYTNLIKNLISEYTIKYGLEDVYSDVNFVMYNSSRFISKKYNTLYFKGIDQILKENKTSSATDLKKIFMNKDVFDKFYELYLETLGDVSSNNKTEKSGIKKKIKELLFIYKVLFIMSNNSDLAPYYKIKIENMLNMYKNQFKDPISYDYNLITNTDKLKNNIKKTYESM
jgi:hypothetical protein